MSRRRTALGILAMFMVQVAAALLPDLDASVAWGVAQSALVFFVAAVVGGWVAGHRFLLPAMAVWLLIWIAIVYLLYRIAAPAGPVSIVGMLQYNWVVMLLSGAATAVGALLGQAISVSRARRVAVT
ncbi:MAG: hypothetical protein ACREO4_15165 [Lysobacter sp.]